ncbi:MAG: DUF4132 domain-containing protein, partial [Myxococcales bacterium]|nr:DUF4132 domain-containing protein [Myxococcales bacterium]
KGERLLALLQILDRAEIPVKALDDALRRAELTPLEAQRAIELITAAGEAYASVGAFLPSRLPTDDHPVPRYTSFGDVVRPFVDTSPHREGWLTLLRHCAEVGTRRTPTQRWRTRIRELATDVPLEPVAGWMTIELAWTGPGSRSGDLEPTRTLVRGLVWALADRGDLAADLGRFAERCLRKNDIWGEKLGNTVLDVLAELPDQAGVAQLSRLKSKVRTTPSRRALHAALETAATRAGLTGEELEEAAVPRFGLVDGQREQPVAGFVARLTCDPPALTWIDAKGKALRSVPAAVKRDAPDALAALQAELKELRSTLTTQRHRLQRLWLQDRSIGPEAFQARYLDHPLVGPMTRRLIWETASGTLLLGDTTDEAMRLWHPATGAEDALLVWRDRLEELEIEQPFPQLWRPVYALQPERFAGRTCDQRQLAELAKHRGWGFPLAGHHGTPDPPGKVFGDTVVRLWLEGDEPNIPYDRVRLVGMDIDAELSPVHASELMYELDVMTAISRRSEDEGALGPLGRARLAVLERALGRIRLDAHIDDPWLVVGERRIHIGSGLAQGEPVKPTAASRTKAKAVFLPHDDPTLVEILALAFTLS